MNREPRGRFASDDGMSIIEVVLAAFILFFVLTAVMGLVWTSTQMGVNAKERTTVANALSAHIEWIRSLDYDQVAIQGTTPSATIPAQITRTLGGFTMVFTTSVTQGTSGIKEVQVDAVASGPGYPTLQMSQHASIRDYDLALTSSTPNVGPKVKFGTETPPQDTAVYSQYYGTSTPLYIDAIVELSSVNTESVITEIKITCISSAIRNGNTAAADVAIFSNPEPSADGKYRVKFRWDTEQINPEIPDGWQMVVIHAQDSDGNPPVTLGRRFLVDNDPPGPPIDPKSQVMAATEARLGWTTPKDGNDDAWEYGVKLFKVDGYGSLVLQNPVDVNGVPIDFKVYPSAFIHSATNPPAAPATPFSRYTAYVRALSYRQLPSDYVQVMPYSYTAGATKAYTTRPLITGTSYTLYTGMAKKGTYAATTYANGSVTPPTFKCSSVTYDLYRGLSTTSMALIKPNTTSTFSDSVYKFLGSSTVAPVYYYQYKVTYTPEGETAAGTEVLWSNIIGPTNITGTESPIPHATW
ncbi:MAG: type IV pilus modification PilV family protein [Coriobacteriia bacterium]